MYKYILYIYTQLNTYTYIYIIGNTKYVVKCFEFLRLVKHNFTTGKSLPGWCGSQGCSRASWQVLAKSPHHHKHSRLRWAWAGPTVECEDIAHICWHTTTITTATTDHANTSHAKHCKTCFCKNTVVEALATQDIHRSVRLRWLQWWQTPNRTATHRETFWMLCTNTVQDAQESRSWYQRTNSN